MRIDNSTVAMSSWRSYTAEAEETQETISRRYNGDTLQKATVHTSKAEISHFEVEGGSAIYTTSSAGVQKMDQGNTCYRHKETDPVEEKKNNSQQVPFQIISAPDNKNWVSDCIRGMKDSPQIELLKKMLELLRSFTGKSGKSFDPHLAMNKIKAAESSFKFSAASSSMRVEEAVAVINGQTNGAASSQSSGSNGVWTRQTNVSGFIAGQESVAFSSTGSVVTSDGRRIDFNVSMEMSRSFAAAYEITGEETVYTDPLVINMDTNRSELDDVTFYFDLDADGVEEEISNLNEFSGLLALDKNNDGEINNGAELFGARTGDGFKELAEYDEDGNGWIDENDSVFNKLSVWIKCGTEDAQLLSLKDADVGAIFLGSQSTNYALADSEGEEGAMVRQTGIYLKESGGAGTVQHVDFKG